MPSDIWNVRVVMASLIPKPTNLSRFTIRITYSRAWGLLCQYISNKYITAIFFIILLEDFTAKELFSECDMVLRGHD